eukprot:TRINITY_DN5013_c0_g1_i1.p2 TRINITY_DN5013_c0_g1~~TRINITY_DN5013_c0_g1_i1.p2  ORF type:complete len:60 (+),score=19.10 TRINITY_DN5013_c0_g1_i1:242-421(+)
MKTMLECPLVYTPTFCLVVTQCDSDFTTKIQYFLAASEEFLQKSAVYGRSSETAKAHRG